MLKQGVFSLDGNLVNVFELTLPTFYRYDIVRDGAEFHMDPDGVIFSIVKHKKKTFIIGDERVKARLDKHVDKVKFAKLPLKSDTKYVDGAFTKTQTRGEDEKFFSRVVERRGKIVEETYQDGDTLLYMFTATNSADMTLIPFNIDEYQTADVGEGVFVARSPNVPEEVLRARFNLKHLDERDYYVCSDLEKARGFLKRVRETLDLNGFDFETTGLEFNLYSKEEVVGVILSPLNAVSWYFPLGHKKFENLPMSFFDEIIETCQYVADRAEEMEKEYEKDGTLFWSGIRRLPDGTFKFFGNGGHNNKFEHKVLRKYGKKLKLKHDSFQMSLAANPVMGRGIHALKTLSSEIDQKKYLEFEDIFTDKGNINFADLEEGVVRLYACPDSDTVRTVLESKIKQMPQDSVFIYDLECELTEVKADQEYWGMRIDVAEYIKGYNVVEKTIKMLEEYIRIFAKWPDLKITSNDALSELLYGKMKCKVSVETKEGKPSTGAGALRKLATEKRTTETNIVTDDIRDASGAPIIKASDLNEARYPIVLFIEKYREASKLMTAFYHRIEKSAVGYFHRTESGELALDKSEGRASLRYFFWINANGAASGRQSSPAHQFPKTIKAYCLPDSSMHRFCGTDYSQIELRLFFSYANEKDFIELCRDPGNDIHRVIGKIISKREMWEISQAIRSKDKQRNFGVVYKMSGSGLAVQKYGAKPTKAQIKEAQQSIDDLFHNFKGALKFINDNEVRVLRDGYMKTRLGRYRPFPQIFDPELPKDKKASLIRQANNTPVQGTAADVMKIAEVKMHKWCVERGWDELIETPEGWFPKVRGVLSAHDEALVSYHVSIPVEEILLMKRECMEMTFEDWAPLFGSSSIIDNWLEGKLDPYAIPIDLRDELIAEYQRTGISCIKTQDHKGEMANLINDHRDKSLIAYMEDLIKTVGTDPQTLADSVRHPSLTHELVSRFKQSKDHKHTHGELSHLESISYAAEKYLVFRENPDFEAQLRKANAYSSEMEEDKSIMSGMAEIMGLSDQLFDFDKDGNMVYEEGESEEEEFFVGDYDAESLESTYTGEKKIFWEMFDQFIIDLEGLTMDQCNEILAILFQEAVADGFSEVHIMFNGKMIDTKMRAKKLSEDVIVSRIKKMLEENDRSA